MRINNARTYIASFFTRSWTFEDYPIEVYQQWPGLDADRVPDVFVARIIGWPAPVGAGVSAPAAFVDLRRQFEDHRKLVGKLPRPGTSVRVQAGIDSTRTGVLHDDHLISGVIDLDPRK